LESYIWPGNIRELRNAVEYALHLCTGGVVERVHLPQHVLTSSAHPDVTAGDLSAGEDRRSLEQVVAEAETRAIAAMLRRHGTDLSAKRQIAADLGISLSTLYAKIERYHLGRR
jgi:transcriptional regulator with PAS, ATPase and Fis domain